MRIKALGFFLPWRKQPFDATFVVLEAQATFNTLPRKMYQYNAECFVSTSPVNLGLNRIPIRGQIDFQFH